MWLSLVTTIVVMVTASLNLRYVEDITNFFPKQQQDISLIFDNLKAKDKLVLLFTSKGDTSDIDQLITCAGDFAAVVGKQDDFTSNASLTLGVNDSLMESMSDFVYGNLPLFLDEDDYTRLDSITMPDAIAARMDQNYNTLLSPIGGYISDYIYRDPLGVGSDVLKQLQDQGKNFKYSIVDNYIFSTDGKTLIAYVDPLPGRSGEKIVDAIESSIGTVQAMHPNVVVEYFGAPAVAAYNARQIKTDSLVTLNIAILIVVIFITLAFRNKYTILLVLTPVIYGALFALSLVYLIQGEISLIAVGSGSIIFGIALSYSIHILSHTNHCNDMRQLIHELAYPLTIGSITTIGAFAGLLFTNSKLLQDFGLFAALTLVGTTLFALVFLPHFIVVKHDERPAGKLLAFVDRISNFHLDKNRVLVISVVVLTLICGLFYSRVGFDSNMMNLNFLPSHLEKAQQRLNSFIGADETQSNVLFIASAAESDEAAQKYGKLCFVLDSLKSIEKISSYSSINRFIVPDSIQVERLAKWNQFWTPQKRAQVISLINKEADRLGFEEGAFSNFDLILSTGYSHLSYDRGSQAALLFPDWISPGESINSYIVQVKLPNEFKGEVYGLFTSVDGVIAADRAFFASKMAEDVSYNFYLVLYISGFLIFFVLLLSYGRIELTLMSFLPMFLSWIVILGIMSLLGIEFNIVTIILSTFIFGIGDDFSIFIMDGLQGEYKDQTRLLGQHKTAIFFSAFTIVVGMGALVFAKHPAMQSLGLISLIGILVVVLMAYTIQPFIFRVLISSQTTRGGFPYTLGGVLNSIYAFGLFVFGCMVIQFLILVSYVTMVGQIRRKAFVHRLTSWATHAFLKAMVTTKMITVNDVNENFEKPSVIIANHQSFIDILLLLGLHHKFVMVTNDWVWHSPFFGRIVRYLDFYHSEDGYSALADSLRDKVKQGYSVIVFPEGTRSQDGKIGRFHKGAFFLAEQLKLDILPILVYGNGLVSSKRQPLYIKKGLLVSKVLPRIPFESSDFGAGYKERSKNIARYFRNEYHNLYEEYNRVGNPYFKDAIIKNYIYKGPVLEWYMRIKLRMENWYDNYDRLLPRKGYIVDLGCGYGAMGYMLSLLSDGRRITGVDYDQKKVDLANNCFARNERIEFVCSDIRVFEIPPADAYVISDVLHYIDHDAQRGVIQQCIDKLNPGGVLVIRDGDASLKERHARTEQSERWSTKIMKFNKTDGPLCFLSKGQILEIAQKNAMSVSIVESDRQTSNTLFILTKKGI